MARTENVALKRFTSKRHVFGIGTNPRDMQRWTEDIWHKHDSDGNMVLDRFELQKFIDTVLTQAGMFEEYNERDLDKYFNQVDITRDGLISKTDFK